MEKLVKTVGAIILGVVGLIFLLTIANVLTFAAVFGWFHHQIYVITGWDDGLAKFVAAIFMALIVALPLGKIGLSATPLPEENKGLYRAIVFLMIAVFFLFAYLGSKDTYFNPETGAPMKYYSIRDGEYKFFSKPGYDPVTGDKLSVATKEIISKMRKGDSPRPAPVRKTSTPESKHYEPAPPPATAPPPEAKLPEPEPVPVVQEEPRSEPKPEPEPVLCKVYLDNKSGSKILVRDRHNKIIDDVNPLQMIVLHLIPGQYVFENVQSGSRTPFRVPENEKAAIIRYDRPSHSQMQAPTTRNSYYNRRAPTRQYHRRRY